MTAWLKILSWNLTILCLLLGTLEAVTRALAPDYVNAYFTQSITHGNRIYRHREFGQRVGQDQVDAVFRRQPGESRVVVIGDSVTFGYGVSHEQTFHQVAHHRLRERNCPAVVYGVGKYGANLASLMASEFRDLVLEELAPDLIVYQFNVNDIEPVATPGSSANDDLRLRQSMEKFRISYLNRSAFLKAVMSFAMRTGQRIRKLKLTDSLRYSPQSDPETFAARWQAFAASLETVATDLRERRIRFAIVMIPESFRVSNSTVDNEFQMDTTGISRWPEDEVREIGGRLNIPVIDTLPALRDFRATAPDRRLFFPNDENHPNAAGHRVIGEALADQMTGQLEACTPRAYEARLPARAAEGATR